MAQLWRRETCVIADIEEVTDYKRCPRCGHDRVWKQKAIAPIKCSKCGYKFEE